MAARVCARRMLNSAKAEDFLETALSAIGAGDGFEAVLDELPVPVYTTDAKGAVTYWNQACVHFAGRQPELGTDRWCVTWQLHTIDGDHLPHDQCPMAEAVKQKRPIRGAIAVAMRPDGTRVACLPYPTPLFDQAGNLTGAVNLLFDVSDEQASALADQASRCRRLSRATHDARAAEVLKQMACGYDDTAVALRSHAD